MTSSLSDQAYHHIQHKLLRASIRTGSKISEQTLARELGISRTPVREAIRRLESEGMLHQVSSSGTFVSEPSRSELIEVYEVRMALESFAVRKATRQMPVRQALELQQFCDQMHEAIRAFRDSGEAIMDGPLLQKYLTADLAFHLLLLRAAGNRYALKLICDVHVRSSIFGYRSHQRDLHHLAQVWLDHARVARAVRRRDGRAAQQWLEHHMESSLNAALEVFDNRRPNTPTTPPPPDLTKALKNLIAEVSQSQE